MPQRRLPQRPEFDLLHRRVRSAMHGPAQIVRTPTHPHIQKHCKDLNGCVSTPTLSICWYSRLLGWWMEAMMVRPPEASARSVMTSLSAVVESRPDVGCVEGGVEGGDRKGSDYGSVRGGGWRSWSARVCVSTSLRGSPGLTWAIVRKGRTTGMDGHDAGERQALRKTGMEQAAHDQLVCSCTTLCSPHPGTGHWG